MIIRHVDASGQRVEADLFGTFAALARDEVASFPALRPHQRLPWHAFLVQVAALALHRAGRADLPRDSEEWRRLLLALTPDWPGGEAWELVVDDWQKPAFLQPPLVKAANEADYKKTLASPDALDMVMTSKNHDLKSERMVAAGDDAWLFALVSLQTQEGTLKASSTTVPGYHGVSRMDGMYGSRVIQSIRPPGRLGAWFARDARSLLEARTDILTNFVSFRDDGDALLWVARWDGQSARLFGGLDPFYVEICRRVRLKRHDGRIRGVMAGSAEPLIAGNQDRRGHTGDAWTPIVRKSTSAFRVRQEGFSYKVVSKLLNGREHDRPPLGDVRRADNDLSLTLVFSGVARDQGKTLGYHERHIPVPKRARMPRPGLARVDAPVLDRAGGVAETRAAEAGKMAFVLKRALFAVLMGGTEKVRLDDTSTDRKAAAWLRLFDARVDAAFFDARFWDEVEGAAASHRTLWRDQLRQIAGDVLDEALEAAPRSEVKRIRVEAQARNLFAGLAGAFVREASDG